MLFVPRVRKSAWRPVRGFLFSFMASSAFYPIIYACFVHGYGRMDLEAGATRYAMTIVVYLSAVTIYAVSFTMGRGCVLFVQGHDADIYGRREFRRNGDRGILTNGDNRIRFFMC